MSFHFFLRLLNSAVGYNDNSCVWDEHKFRNWQTNEQNSQDKNLPKNRRVSRLDSDPRMCHLNFKCCPAPVPLNQRVCGRKHHYFGRYWSMVCRQTKTYSTEYPKRICIHLASRQSSTLQNSYAQCTQMMSNLNIWWNLKTISGMNRSKCTIESGLLQS